MRKLQEAADRREGTHADKFAAQLEDGNFNAAVDNFVFHAKELLSLVIQHSKEGGSLQQKDKWQPIIDMDELAAFKTMFFSEGAGDVSSKQFLIDANLDALCQAMQDAQAGINSQSDSASCVQSHQLAATELCDLAHILDGTSVTVDELLQKKWKNSALHLAYQFVQQLVQKSRIEGRTALKGNTSKQLIAAGKGLSEAIIAIKELLTQYPSLVGISGATIGSLALHAGQQAAAAAEEVQQAAIAKHGQAMTAALMAPPLPHTPEGGAAAAAADAGDFTAPLNWVTFEDNGPECTSMAAPASALDGSEVQQDVAAQFIGHLLGSGVPLPAAAPAPAVPPMMVRSASAALQEEERKAEKAAVLAGQQPAAQRHAAQAGLVSSVQQLQGGRTTQNQMECAITEAFEGLALQCRDDAAEQAIRHEQRQAAKENFEDRAADICYGLSGALFDEMTGGGAAQGDTPRSDAAEAASAQAQVSSMFGAAAAAPAPVAAPQGGARSTGPGHV
jgi:hypothetical protein